MAAPPTSRRRPRLSRRSPLRRTSGARRADRVVHARGELVRLRGGHVDRLDGAAREPRPPGDAPRLPVVCHRGARARLLAADERRADRADRRRGAGVRALSLVVCATCAADAWLAAGGVPTSALRGGHRVGGGRRAARAARLHAVGLGDTPQRGVLLIGVATAVPVVLIPVAALCAAADLVHRLGGADGRDRDRPADGGAPSGAVRAGGAPRDAAPPAAWRASQFSYGAATSRRRASPRSRSRTTAMEILKQRASADPHRRTRRCAIRRGRRSGRPVDSSPPSKPVAGEAEIARAPRGASRSRRRHAAQHARRGARARVGRFDLRELWRGRPWHRRSSTTSTCARSSPTSATRRTVHTNWSIRISRSSLRREVARDLAALRPRRRQEHRQIPARLLQVHLQPILPADLVDSRMAQYAQLQENYASWLASTRASRSRSPTPPAAPTAANRPAPTSSAPTPSSLMPTTSRSPPKTTSRRRRRG